MKNTLTIVAASALLSGNAHGQEFTYYRYSERGAVGHMIVLNEGSRDVPLKPIGVSILAGNSKTQHVCEVRARENTDARITSGDSIEATMQVTTNDMKEVTKDFFEIKFNRSSALIAYSQMQSNCGLTAAFSGNWRKVKSIEAATSPK